jgi:hypothetical protein
VVENNVGASSGCDSVAIRLICSERTWFELQSVADVLNMSIGLPSSIHIKVISLEPEHILCYEFLFSPSFFLLFHPISVSMIMPLGKINVVVSPHKLSDLVFHSFRHLLSYDHTMSCVIPKQHLLLIECC